MSSHNFTKPTKKNSHIIDNENIRITKINIDSMHRNQESKNILDTQVFNLSSDPITIINNSINESEMIISHPGHDFSPGDNIIIQGAKSTSISLSNAITFIGNSPYARIQHKNHDLDFTTINDIYIYISGFIGNRNNNTEYYNIPINKINNLHKIYFIKSENEIHNNDYYYIHMDNVIADFSKVYDVTALNIVFTGINGINLNLINANYPLSIDQVQGYHIINSVSDDTYTIQLQINNNINIYNKGGDNVWITKVIEFIEGYENNNYYIIPLKKTFNNITKIKLISTEFPNTEKVIKSIPESKKNNMFYWKLENDGSTIYSVEMESGNYSIDLLENNLSTKIELLNRDTLRIINKNNAVYSYYEKHQCTITIEPRTDIFSIRFYSTIFYPRAITYKANTSFTDNIGRLIITHPNHRLEIDNIITIINALTTDSIPSDVVNNSFLIERVIDENTYQLKLPKYNVSSTNIETTNGGDSMGIRYPIKAQILMDKPDTIGKLIGYRNVGKSNAISNYNYLNTNKDVYQNDFTIDNQYTNNTINLSGNNYILMTCPLFTDSYNSGITDNIFAKILLADDPGTIIYNQYVQLGENFNPPLNQVSEWEVAFYDVDDELYNFGNLDHSYTLEIHEKLIN
jgi:hypothetical protein